MKIFVPISVHKYGYREHTSTLSAISVLKEDFHTYCRGGSTVYARFLNLSKALERVDHKTISKKFIEKGMPSQMVDSLKCVFSNTKVKVEFNGQYSDFRRGKSGVIKAKWSSFS